ncbi:ParA family protein [Azohydromonas lata]|uniref:ParA family protein n=1 Tax=Azohydromonas lata TaxID=45677 RepID=UPI000836B2FB|nr:ParA family protein [Azohydromonas lata]
MKTIVIAIQKGGQGKTFATCHLAQDFTEKRKLRVAVVDLDAQGDASFTLEAHDSGYAASRLFTDSADAVRAHFSARDNSGLTLIHADPALIDIEQPLTAEEACGALKASMAVLAEFFDVCLIDTPPALGVRMTAAIMSADFMLSPIEMEAYSVRGMSKMFAVMNNLLERNPHLQFLGMLPNKVEKRKPRHQANLASLRESYPDLVMPVKVGLRDSIGDALEAGVPVWRIEKTAARDAIKEVRQFADYVFEKMEIAQ